MIEKEADMSVGEFIKNEISGKFFFIKDYEAILNRFGLGKSQISSQSLYKLEDSLLRIEDIINNNSEDFPGDFLFERKKLILERIKEVSSEEKIITLHDLVNKLPEGEERGKIKSELDSLRQGAEKYKQEIQRVDIAAREAEAAIKLEQQRIDGLERKSKIWLSFLQRESAASIIGGIVLLMLTVALISGMIFGRESQILSNGFLVILGYFFGQSSSKNKDSV